MVKIAISMGTVGREEYCMSLDLSCDGESNGTKLNAQLSAVPKLELFLFWEYFAIYFRGGTQIKKLMTKDSSPDQEDSNDISLTTNSSVPEV